VSSLRQKSGMEGDVPLGWQRKDDALLIDAAEGLLYRSISAGADEDPVRLEIQVLTALNTSLAPNSWLCGGDSR